MLVDKLTSDSLYHRLSHSRIILEHQVFSFYVGTRDQSHVLMLGRHALTHEAVSRASHSPF